MVVRVFRDAASNSDLRRVLVAFIGFNAAEWGVWIAMLVYAYDQGGATTAGVVAVVQLVPAALAAPALGRSADRRRPTQVLTAGYLAQAAAMAATAGVLLAGGPSLLAYAFAAVATTAVTVTRPAQAGLMPALARTPEELTAANVLAGWIESVSVLAAPALAGVLLTVGGAGAVFAVMAVAVLAGALLVARVRGPAGGVATGAPSTLRAAAADPAPRALVWLLAVEGFAIGALDVLYVVLAVGVLGHGGSVAGYLNAAFGAGGVIGVAVTVALVGRTRLAPPLLVGLLVWAVALACTGLVASLLPAFLLLAAAGLGRTIVDVAGRTLLQRVAEPTALAQVFGLVESASMAGLAVGSLAASGFVAAAGGRGAFVCVSALLPAAALLVLRRVLAADAHARPVVEIALLRELPMFALLRPPALEGIARSLEHVEAAAGATLIREGERGDRFFVVADGAVAVSVGGAQVATLGRGECFGEIALLRDVPRTATVVATVPTRLATLDGVSFVAAVTGHAPSLSMANALAHDRLERATLLH